jgi:hypothetical protein
MITSSRWPAEGRAIGAGWFRIPQLDSLVGLGRVELPTSRLSGVRSNHLSYRPASVAAAGRAAVGLNLAPSEPADCCTRSEQTRSTRITRWRSLHQVEEIARAWIRAGISTWDQTPPHDADPPWHSGRRSNRSGP